MRLFAAAALFASCLTALPSLALDTTIPARRAILTQDVDLPGSDLQAIFDTTLEACEQACLTNAQCKALTFNSRAGSCFPKTAAGKAAPYTGAFSAIVVDTPKATIQRAETRKKELSFLTDDDFSTALTQAQGAGPDAPVPRWPKTTRAPAESKPSCCACSPSSCGGSSKHGGRSLPSRPCRSCPCTRSW